VADELGVWLEAARVGTLTRGRRGLRFAYSDEAVERWPGNTPLISCSLPVSTRTQVADAFFEGLLPEGSYRDQLAGRAGVVSSDAFGLLRAYGRDIAGALVVSDTDVGPRPGEVLPLSGEDLATEVAELTDRPLGVHDDSELSIPGLQDKMLLVDLGDGRWGRPLHGRPSTHILKLDHRLHRGLVAAEGACLAVARAAGLPAADAQLVAVGDADCLIIRRFDRSNDVDAEGNLLTHRIHQEDSCQALGRSPRQKYEVRQGGGGPELSEIAALLDRHAAEPTAELYRLLEAVTFRVLIGDADAHGKNITFLLDPPGTIRLAPLYDTVPTVLWPQLNTEAAMTIAGMLNLASVTPETIAAEAHRWRLPRDPAAALATDVAQRVRAVVEENIVGISDERLRAHLLTRTGRFLGL